MIVFQRMYHILDPRKLLLFINWALLLFGTWRTLEEIVVELSLIGYRIVRVRRSVLLYWCEVYCVVRLLLSERSEHLGPAIYRSQAPRYHCAYTQLFAFKIAQDRFNIDIRGLCVA